jgi:hypothetical protein
MKVPFLGAIPMDPMIAESGDTGQAYITQYKDSDTAGTMRHIAEPVIALDNGGDCGSAGIKSEADLAAS